MKYNPYNVVGELASGEDLNNFKDPDFSELRII